MTLLVYVLSPTFESELVFLLPSNKLLQIIATYNIYHLMVFRNGLVGWFSLRSPRTLQLDYQSKLQPSEGSKAARESTPKLTS